MRKESIWTAVAVAAVLVATVSSQADAFCHKYRSVPIWFGAYYPNCGTCGPCIVPYMISGSICGAGCGYGCNYGYGCGGGCGYGYGCGGGCVKKHHHCWIGHKLWRHATAGCGSCFGGCDGYASSCGSCYSGCDGGCGGGCSSCDGGCGSCGGACDGGCSGGCSGGGAGCSSCGSGGGSAEVLYDGPSADAPPVNDQSAGVHRPLMLLTGMRLSNQEDGSAAFGRGVTAYRHGSLNDASRDFEAAANAEPNNALYQYYRALALHDTLGADAAEGALQQAVEAEKRESVSGWGKQMERVQGRSRLWIEKARRDAGLTR